MNGKKIASFVNEKPRKWCNVRVFTSNPWMNAQHAYIKNLVVDATDVGGCDKPGNRMCSRIFTPGTQTDSPTTTLSNIKEE